ncbi:carbohydrate-binding domain-containing protein [Blautia liquoris]|uniref:Carbohydrate-binding domain-containing protein n=1 Tax=Blautia liquoris TaxID=2779518 RepID=A0A7M2RCZ8_9FIRM|nr:carbohydrate-binding domain-containing protein [Blautia liquoris]QOV18156.1 carbohydrate-binding domain-containing protein [Blautia liquoris]
MKTKYLISGVLLSVMLIAGMTGCGSTSNTSSSSNTRSSTTTAAKTAAAASTKVEAADISYDEDDKDDAWSKDDVTTITLDDSSVKIDGSDASETDGVITIKNAGTYEISGTLLDGQIVVEANSDDVVHIVLNGANITSSDGPVINGTQSGKIILTLAEGTENKLTDGNNYSDLDDDEEPDAAIFSKDDLTINGAGTLNVKGNYKNGIHGKDGVKVISGVISIDAVNHAVSGKDYIAVSGGTLNLTSVEDALHSATDVQVTDGKITISAGDDAIHADSTVTIDGGTILIDKSNEGIEGTVVTINDGDISVTSSDDGINGSNGLTDNSSDTSDASSGQDTKNGPGRMGGSMENDENVLVTINGGKIYINAEGDSIDSNGSLTITGGETVIDGTVSGGNGILDYNGKGIITGGTLIGVGTSDMAQSFSDGSTQYSLLYGFDSSKNAGTKVSLKDSSGSEMISTTAAKTYQAVVISFPDLSKGGTYSLYINDTKVEDITLDSVSTQAGNISGQGRPGGESGQGDPPKMQEGGQGRGPGKK